MKRRIISLMLSASLLLSAVPMPAFATEESQGLCEHHAAHTEECGYAPAVEASDCGHVHSDDCQKPMINCVHGHGDECWKHGVDGGDPVLECVHTECTVQSGCVAADISCVHQHGEECWQTAAEGEESILNCVHTECTIEYDCVTVKLVCNHEHDASCGYTEGSAEVPCSYECEICNSIKAGFCAHGNGIESCALCQLEALIDSLPAYEELGALEGDSYTEAISDVQEAQVTYYGLSTEQQAQVRNADVLLTLLNGPEDQPTPAVGEDWKSWTQSDNRWGTLTLGTSSDTVAGYGCLVTSVTKLIIQAGLKDANSFNVATMVEWMNSNNGFDSNGNMYWEKPAQYSGLSYLGWQMGNDTFDSNTLNDTLVNYVAQGYHIVLQINNGSHYVAIDNELTLSTGQVYIMDSLSSGNNSGITLSSRYPTFTAVNGYSGGTAVTAPTSGSCGENVTWELVDGVLTISGAGPMSDYESGDDAPWKYHASKITKVEVCDGVTNVGNHAFDGATQPYSSLTTVILADTVTSVGDYAFFSVLWSITSVEVSDNLEHIGDYAFSGNLLSEFDFPEGLCSIGDGAFWGSYLTRITLPDSLTDIGSYVFGSCDQLTDFTLPGTMSAIPEGMFYICDGLKTVTVPATIKEIGTNAFASCKNLETVILPEGLTIIGESSFGGQASGQCYKLKNINIPSTVTKIGNGAFFGAESLAEIIIPKNVTEIGEAAFCACRNLSAIYFEGNAPDFAESEDYPCFQYVTATVYYPDNDSTWTDAVRKDYGGTLTWVAYDPGEERPEPGKPDEETASPCRLSELQPLDYLAFSKIAYTSAAKVSKTMTVFELFADVWDTEWKENIKYSELFAHIAGWSVYDYSENDTTGFGAYAFQNENNEYVIAFRGSRAEPVSGTLSDTNDWFNDWLLNNLPMFFGGNGTQTSDALSFANRIILNAGSAEAVHITGHSLGGALCDIVSARYACYAESFNAAPFLATAYCYYPQEMGILFSGVNNWKFKDHTTNGDILVGERGKEMKNYIIHDSSKFFLNLIGNHGLDSFLEKDASGNVKLTEIQSTQTISNAFMLGMVSTGAKAWGLLGDIYMGTSGHDSLYFSRLTGDVSAYGGNGSDIINAEAYGDIIVGGPGDDNLAGRSGNDRYYYFKGDGEDVIVDSAGHDTLYLLDFSETDEITAERNEDYVEIFANNDLIVSIACDRDGRGQSFTIKMGTTSGSKSRDITSLFRTTKIVQSLRIACPVNVEIIDDATGTVVQTLYNLESSVGIYDTDYGYFYVYPDDEGNYVKAADLFEGYSIRIVGAGTGTMDVSLLEPDADGNVQIKSAVDVPVTENTIATIEQDSDTGNFYLSIDNDGDNVIDQKIQIPNDSEKEIAIDAANFPDPIFQEYVKQFDTDSSGGFNKSELDAVNAISVGSMSISSLEGIQFFTKLTYLSCGENQLTALDVSSNTELTQLHCGSNQLNVLDISRNTALTHLECSGNQLSSLNVQNNLALISLSCGNPQLTALDVSKNTLLTYLGCVNTQITELDVSHNTALTTLNCYDNYSLTTLDVRSNTALTSLACFNCRLTELDVRNNTALTNLDCGNNRLTALDLRNNTALTALCCFTNELTELDVSKNIALTKLECNSNQLTKLDVSHNIALERLWCESNHLTTLDVSNNRALEYLNCDYNHLTSLHLEANTVLTDFHANANEFEIQPDSKRSFDLTTLPGSFDVSMASNWAGGTVNGNILTVDADTKEVTYTYDCGNGKSAEFTLTIGEVSGSPATASYQVKHYQQNLDGVNYTLKDTQNLSGPVGTTTEAAAKSYEGFTAQPIVQKAIAAEGTTVVEIYYDRNTYSLKVVAGDGIECVSVTIGGETAMLSRAANTVRYGQTVTLDATPKKHHTVVGWYTGNDLVSSNHNYSFTMPARTVQLTAKAQLNRYTVTFVADNKVVSTQTVEHGKDAVMPKVPVKLGYTGKWDHDGKSITADTIITAKYTGIMNIDWSNPSTGDYIMIAVAIMVISGTGLATILFLYKRKNKNNK